MIKEYLVCPFLYIRFLFIEFRKLLIDKNKQKREQAFFKKKDFLIIINLIKVYDLLCMVKCTPFVIQRLFCERFLSDNDKLFDLYFF